MSESLKYKMLQGCFWMLYCAATVYFVYYLQEMGIAVSMIGVVGAVCGVVSAFLQAYVGKLADKGSGFNWKSIMLVLVVINFFITAGMAVFDAGMAVVILYSIFLLLVNCMIPLVNAACFYYQKNDIIIDFGIARAVGSLSFAVMSVIVGRLTVLFGAPAVTGTGLTMTLLLLLIVYSLPYYGDVLPENQADGQPSGKRGNFLARYPAFVLMAIGLSLVLAFHNCSQIYMLMLLEHVGGSSDNLGMAIAIAAVMELVVLLRFSTIHQWFGTKKLLLACGVFYCLRGGLYLLAGDVWHIYLIQSLQAVTFAIYASASTYYADEEMANEDKVTGQGVMAAVLTVGWVIGNLQGGFTFDMLGVDWMLGISLAIAVLGTIFIILANRKSASSICCRNDVI